MGHERVFTNNNAHLFEMGGCSVLSLVLLFILIIILIIFLFGTCAVQYCFSPELPDLTAIDDPLSLSLCPPTPPPTLIFYLILESSEASP